MVSASDIFQARNVALIGATDKSHWPQNIYANMIESGFEGNLWPINPRRDEIFGVKCYPDLHSTPRPADLALLIIPAAAIPETLASGAEVGLKSAVVYAAGFGDGGRPESIERGKRLKSQLNNLDISVCGPNCMGLVGIREKLYCYPHAHIRNLEPGPTALITQSGGTLSYYLRAGAERGITFSYAVSSGNEISLDLSDYINFCIDDPETKQICLFIEGIRKPEAFMRACGRALEAEKPIIAIKTGRSQKSREAAQSHSGAVSGDYAGYEAVCERYGIINCETLEEMIEMTVGFQQRRWPQGPRVAFMTTSGGTVDLLHDYCEEQGTSVPDLNEATIEKIRPFVPSDCHIRNPIDTGAPVGKSGKSSPVEICKAFASDPNVDIVAWCNNMPGSARSSGAEDEIVDLLKSTEKPVFSFARMPHQIPNGGLDFQKRTGMPFVQGTRIGVRVANALWFFSQRRGKTPITPNDPKGEKDQCDGEALIDSLEQIGIQKPRSLMVQTPEDAGNAAAEIGFPVAIKIVSPQASHKTEIGGVSLGIQNSENAKTAAFEMEGRLKSAQAESTVDGFLIQEMVSGVEVLVGTRTDPLYGPMLVLGTGGTMVELIRDISLSLLPVSKTQIRHMIAKLKLKKQLAGWRGSPEADIDALIKAILSLSTFYLDHRTWLKDIEINPLMVLPKGHGVRAIDVRTVLHN